MKRTSSPTESQTPVDPELIKYFIAHTDKRFDKQDAEIKEMRVDVAKILKFKWSIMGAGVGISFIVSVLFQIAAYIFK